MSPNTTCVMPSAFSWSSEAPNAPLYVSHVHCPVTRRRPRRSACPSSTSGRRPCERLRVPSSSHIVSMATTSSCERARNRAAQLSFPPDHEIAALKTNLHAHPDRALQRLIAQRLHVVLVADVVDREEAADLRGHRIRHARVPRREAGIHEDRRAERREVGVDELADEHA